MVARLYEIEVSGDLAGVYGLPRHIKFASAKALNDTGAFAQEEIIRELDVEFEIRGNWPRPKTRFGINKINATFSDVQPEVTLFTRADWLLESEGYNAGVKVAENNKGRNEHLADPYDPNTRGAIKNKFPASQKAFTLLAQGQGNFIGTNADGTRKRGRGFRPPKGIVHIKPKGLPGVEYIFQRVGVRSQVGIGPGAFSRLSKKGVPVRGSRKGGSILVLKHVLKKSVKVEQPKVFQRTAINTYRVWYPTYLGRNLTLALRTAKL